MSTDPLFARQSLLPKPAGNTGGDGANEKSMMDAAVEAAKKLGSTIPKLAGVAVNLSSLGEVSITQPIDK